MNNLVYSVQWLIFGMVGLFGWWRLIRTESRRAEEDPDEDEAAAIAAEETAT